MMKTSLRRKESGKSQEAESHVRSAELMGAAGMVADPEILAIEEGWDLEDQEELAESPAPEPGERGWKPAREAIEEYLEDISNLRVLSAQEEIALAVRVGRGDRRAMSELVSRNLRLVVSIAKKYARNGVPLLDLVQEGNIGLIRAAEKFDPSRGFRFSTYAVWWIRQSVTRALGQLRNAVRLPVARNGDVFLVTQAVQRTMENGELSADPAKVAQALGWTEDRVRFTCALAQSTASLDAAPGSRVSGTKLKDLVARRAGPSADSLVMHNALQRDLGKILLSLRPPERMVIMLRFGIGGRVPMSLSDVGRLVGRSRERIRQIEVRALKRLRDSGKLASYYRENMASPD